MVREVEGFRVTVSARGKHGRNRAPGLTVWVADEALYGKEMKVWRSEDMTGVRRVLVREVCRRSAKALAKRLNAEDRMRL